jgi:hypothetical protein
MGFQRLPAFQEYDRLVYVYQGALLIMSSVGDFTTYLFVIVTLIGAGVQIYHKRNTVTRSGAAEILLVWFFAIQLGVAGIWSFLAHTVFAAQVAASIGWQAGNPFQQEVAVANLAIGVLGFLSVRMNRSFRLATIISFSIFMIGAGIGHVYQLVVFNDTAINNAGPVMYLDFIVPIIMILLYIIRYEKGLNVSSSPTP